MFGNYILLAKNFCFKKDMLFCFFYSFNTFLCSYVIVKKKISKNNKFIKLESHLDWKLLHYIALLFFLHFFCFLLKLLFSHLKIKSNTLFHACYITIPLSAECLLCWSIKYNFMLYIFPVVVYLNF
jgi:hypothetical protein